jgi:hypothetical protein
MYHSHFLLRRLNIDEVKYYVNWRMFERNSIGGKTFHIFFVHPVQQYLLWYYIIGFAVSVKAEIVIYLLSYFDTVLKRAQEIETKAIIKPLEYEKYHKCDVMVLRSV